MPPKKEPQRLPLNPYPLDPKELLKSEHLQKMLTLERELRQQGYKRIAGIDEAGRGPLAGPVVAAACVINEGVNIPEVNDSKQLTAEQRQNIFLILTTHPEIHYGVGVVSSQIIDQINIAQATFQAMREALAQLTASPDYLLVDGFKLPGAAWPCERVIGGDARCYSIAAASIIAKVIRDRLMSDFHELYPLYGFSQHKGYATKAHKQALQQHGPSPIHRHSFAPVKEAAALSL